MRLQPNEKLSLREILKDLDKYRPRRRGWTWRKPLEPGRRIGPFEFRECSEPLAASVPLPAAKYFDYIDPQPDCVITTEIASGRFEDDIRRMRMAAWHGADHIMVIRTAGQSHFDGLIEGTPEGVGGVPITRKQVRATRKALDAIEDEIGRPINFHSYVSGMAGPEIAVLFVEEGVNGAHQDANYNVLYRNINMIRSYVDAAEAKCIMAYGGILQIDGAHNANATARQAWKVMPELLVQHAVNCAFSRCAGMPAESIALSTVPPTAPPAPKLFLDLPYAVALRDLFSEYKMRAQMNTRYMESDLDEATVTHVLDTLVSRLTSADIQSTITPDEGRNVPWHYNNVRAVNAAKQTLVGLDGLRCLVKLDRDGPLGRMVRELKERAVLFLEEIRERGYFQAIEDGHFVDSGFYPERAGDGISRPLDGGVGAGTVVARAADYVAPVCAHFGDNHLPEGLAKPCDLIGGCTLCDPAKIVYIDELDPEDNVEVRLARAAEQGSDVIRPEVEWAGDGVVVLNLMFPEEERVAKAAAMKMAEKLGLLDPLVIHTRVMHPAEGTYVELKGVFPGGIRRDELVIEPEPLRLKDAEIEEFVRTHQVKAVAATVGNDEHSVGLREIIDIKHGGLEKFGFKCTYLGTSVPLEKVLDAAVETGAQVILISTIITHNDIHRICMRKLHNLALEKGIREGRLLIAGGTQVTNEMARECGMDAGFGRGTKGHDVASFIVKALSDKK
jgi:D-ornithine 4,5-aminomutase subunit beta